MALLGWDLQRLLQECRGDEESAALRGRSGVGFPEVGNADETIHGVLSRNRQRRFRSEPERFVLAANEDRWQPFNLVRAELEARIVCQPDGQAALEEVTAEATLEVHGVADLGLAVFLLRL